MTTICYKNGIVAADRGMSIDGVVYAVRKLYRVELHEALIRQFKFNEDNKSFVFASVGESSLQQLVIGTLTNGIELPKTVYEGEFFSLGMLVSKKTKRCYQLSNNFQLTEYLEPPIAIGAGAEMALGAMLAGVSAPEAVRIVASRSSYAALGVDVEAL